MNDWAACGESIFSTCSELKHVSSTTEASRVCVCQAVVGSVGSGKSTLLSALLGEMSKRAGRVELRGRVALCTQQPWLITGTLKENVLFGLPYDDEKFWRTLEVRPIPRVSLCSNLYCCPVLSIQVDN